MTKPDRNKDSGKSETSALSMEADPQLLALTIPERANIRRHFETPSDEISIYR